MHFIKWRPHRRKRVFFSSNFEPQMFTWTEFAHRIRPYTTKIPVRSWNFRIVRIFRIKSTLLFFCNFFYSKKKHFLCNGLTVCVCGEHVEVRIISHFYKESIRFQKKKKRRRKVLYFCSDQYSYTQVRMCLSTTVRV